MRRLRTRLTGAPRTAAVREDVPREDVPREMEGSGAGSLTSEAPVKAEPDAILVMSKGLEPAGADRRIRRIVKVGRDAA